MDFQDKQYVIGIDLGTTNSAVSYVDVAALMDDKSTGKKNVEKKDHVKIFNVPQLTGYGEFTKIPVLPSFLYIPGEYDISKEALKHPWKKREDLFAGSFARDHGSQIPSRLVSSAKSWLCNHRVDRRSKILPWGSEGFEKISPVTATSEYLLHIKNAWNHFVKEEDKFIENQFVVITIPASFNEEARDLTMEAIKTAGFGPLVTLLEEPLAAFYSWLVNHENDWQKHVKADDLILVCDVGGGTTDFSLISLKESEGTPRFERIAVGDHLILGGDNIDLALARKVESKFKSKSRLTSDKWKTLCHRCREAKEKILDRGEPSVRITIKGEGRSLIAGTLAADLTKEEVEKILLDDFYPYVESVENLNIDTGKEITDFGLPFEKESAVTRHIIRFLENHREDVRKNLSKDPLPDFILFNGGTIKPVLVQERIRQVIGKWFKASESKLPKILENKNPDLAVGIGASYYGLVKFGEGVRVGSGSPRSYYIGVSANKENFSNAVCIVERGLDEGSVIDLPQMKYEVRANEPVSFDVYYSSYRSGDKAGEVVIIDDSFSSMTPIQTIIKFGKNGYKKTIPVTIGAEYTEMGTLSMYCHSGVSDHKWKLQFQLRDIQKGIEFSETQIYDEALITDACNLVQQVFTDESDTTDSLKNIGTMIEKIVVQKKFNWPLSFLRSIADKLIELEDTRKYSAEHEARWLNLTGFCARPGFGDAFDEERSRKLWKIYLSGLRFEKTAQNRLEWWIFIRRIAAGLKAGQQRQFFQDISSLLIKGKGSKSKIFPQEQVELWMASGNMERLLVKDKVVLAGQFEIFIKIDLEKRRDLHVHFAGSLEPKTILSYLELAVGRIIPGKTLLFFDEIQACPRAIMALRYFYEQMPELHVIAAGSMLEFAFDKISIPVGRVQYLHMHPMTFYEYLLAMGKEPMAQYVLISPAGVDKTIQQMILNELRTYFFVGGMPECIKTYRDTDSMVETFQVQSEILDSYRDDFFKYMPRIDPICLDAVFLNVAKSIGKQLKYTRLNEGHSGQTNRKAFDLLARAKVIHKISACNPSGLPLGATANHKKFKASFLDIGLLQRLCQVPVELELQQENLLAIYRGKLAEQFIAQELIAWHDSNLFYWSRDARGSNAEVDYLIVCKGKIYPIEVKSGAGGSLKSLHLMLENYSNCPEGFVFYHGMYKNLSDQKLVFFPLYAIAGIGNNA